jgi:integrase
VFAGSAADKFARVVEVTEDSCAVPRMKLTDRGVVALRPSPGKQVDYFDDRMPGFGLRVSSTGHRSWIVLYRTGRRLRRLTLGTYPVLSLADARAKAKLVLSDVVQGKDPAHEKQVARRAETFGELAAEYLEKHAKARKRSWREDQRMIERELLPVWRHVRAKDVSRRDVRQLLEKIVERNAPIQANRVFALVRKMFNFGLERDIVSSSPCLGLGQPMPNRQRDRVLSENELRAIWQAIGTERPLIAATFKLRLLTAQRGAEVLSMRWEHLDLVEGWWTIPGELTKNGRSHRVPLSGAALAVLDDMPRSDDGGRELFPSPTKDGSVRYAQKAVERVRKVAGLDFTGHDLRRTAASYMTSLGISRLTVGKLLNHVETGVTAVYDRHSYDSEKREALEIWGRRLTDIVSRGDGRATLPIKFQRQTARPVPYGVRGLGWPETRGVRELREVAERRV